jgi:hypothetical protein
VPALVLLSPQRPNAPAPAAKPPRSSAPSALVISGACAGLTVEATTHGATTAVVAGPTPVTRLHLAVGDDLLVRAHGPCADSVGYATSGSGGLVSLKQGAITGLELTATKAGSVTAMVTIHSCALEPNPACLGGITQMAAVAVQISPASSSGAAPPSRP